MPQKISRDVSLIKYRQFPLWEFDEKTQEEFSFYPKINSHYWLKLDDSSDHTLIEKLPTELTKLYQNLGVDELIFFSAHNMRWISKFTSERDDLKPLKEAVKYFDKNGLSGKFNGGIEVFRTEFLEFFKHFYILTECDSGFFHNHFLDKNQKLLGYIHYSGEVQFDTFDNDTNEKFLIEIKKTDFVDIKRDNTNRI
jgi:hypothetical protein